MHEQHHDHTSCSCGCGCGHDHQHHDHASCGCGCGHDHEHHEHASCSCGCGHEHPERNELPGILIGAITFASGILLSKLFPPLHIPVFLAAYLVLGWRVLFAAGKNILKGRVFDENFLMSIATIGAFAIGEFPEGAGVMLFYRIGEYFEHKAMERSRKRIMDAVDLRPETVTLASGETIPAAEAKVGDLLLVKPGDRIPLDSIVISGESHADTSAITGESLPVSLTPGAHVLSGCVNLDAVLTVRVEKPLSESMVTRILNSVEHAAAGKPKMDRFLTRFSRVYTPIVVLIAAATAIIPSLIWGNWGYWVYTALSFLVMSCPCALVLSVPLAFFCGIGTGSKKGILFKSGASIESMANIKAVVMDKTGTLTKGDFSVQKVVGDGTVLSLCAACEQRSNHPIAKSIVAAAGSHTLPQPEQLEELPGHGIKAVLNGQQILCGNRKLMAQFGVNLPETEECGTEVFVAADGVYLGHLVVADTVKPDAENAVKALKTRGIFTAMLTGDRQETAEAVGKTLSIDSVHAGLLPQDKLALLQAIRKEQGAVMFVGDGINDAPVLAGADVGAAMGSGADAAIEAADTVFLTSAAAAIPEALQIARQTKNIAWQNVVFALGIKAIVMVLGLLGYASMWAAVFADSGVAMLCVLNAIRLLYRKK